MTKNNRLVFNRYAGWALVAIFVAIPVVRWMQINSITNAISGTNFAYFSMLGRLSALIGIVLYAINFVISTRIKVLESLFGGLNRAYIAHHIIGGLALIAILIHPLALALRYVPNDMRAAAEFLIPPLAGEIDIAVMLGSFALFGMAFLLVLTFFVKLPYGLWLFTHKFLGVSFLIAGIHVMLIPSDTSADTFLRFYILGWVAIGLVAFVYRTLLSRVFVRRHEYVVSKIETPADRITRITLRPKSSVIDYRAGQFIFIKFHQQGIPAEFHPFSISSSELDDSNELSITVKSLGDFTATMPLLQEGTKAEIEGAFGRFTNTRYTQPRQIWIAGGIGVTPFISMAKSLAKRQSQNLKDFDYDINMFYVVRNQSELVSQDELSDISDLKDIKFTFHTYLSDEKKKLISAEYIKLQTGGLEKTDIFICGPPPMMKSLSEDFMKLGVKKKYIHTEEFSIT